MTPEPVVGTALEGRPAVLGGTPAFPEGLPLVRPQVPDPDEAAADVRAILESRQLTNGPRVRDLEERIAAYAGVRHCVAVASCTLGLMLVLRARGLAGDVIVPSFTFSATVHAVAWNGLRPVFADVDARTLTVTPDTVRGVGQGAVALLATHVFGTPCDVEGLGEEARERGIDLIFDAAHALGSRHRGTPMGQFGTAEVFSLTPTKLVVAGEGGVIATNDDDLAEACRIGREYGHPGDYDTRFVGLNARMSEVHAALAIRSLEGLDERVAHRGALAERYRGLLSPIRGVAFPEVLSGDVSTYKDFSLLVDPDGFGIDADCLGRSLAAEGIDTRRYYSPPVHTHRAYRDLPPASLPVTERAARRALTLPLWSEMTVDHVARVAAAVARIQRYPEVAAACAG
jgi:dTDP-4-amino-4,6-dideoxygalactose transaminase